MSLCEDPATRISKPSTTDIMDPDPPPAAIGSSIKIVKRTDRSLCTFFLQHLIKTLSFSTIFPSQLWPAGSPQLKVHRKATKKCRVEERVVDRIYLYDFDPKQPVAKSSIPEKEAKKRRLYYFAGGGWRMPPSPEHWALLAEISNKLPDLQVTLISYPLAPNSPAPQAFPQLMTLFSTLMHTSHGANEHVMLGGDSAGGNIALCLSIAALKDESIPGPSSIFAISPSTDLRRSNPDMKKVQKHDPILRMKFLNTTAHDWRGHWEADDPRISPNFADLAPLLRRGIKVNGMTGTYDMLMPDAIIFRDRLEAAGVEGEWLDWDKQMHCFLLTWCFWLREGVEAKEWLLEKLRTG